MKPKLEYVVGTFTAAWLLCSPLLAQQAAEDAAPLKPAATAETNVVEKVVAETDKKRVGDLVRVFSDVVLEQDERCHDVVVVMGSAILKGDVSGDVVVVCGDATILGKVGKDVVVVGGSVQLGPKAEVGHELVVIGGKLDRRPGAKLARKPVEIGLGKVFPEVTWLKEWLTYGVFKARLLPPQVPWVWWIAGAFFIVYLLLSVLLPGTIQACMDTLEKRPVGSFFTGVLVKVLFAPLCLLLIMTVAGILVVPFLWFGFLGALLLGKAVVLRYTGQQLGRQFGLVGLQQPVVALIIGAAIFCLLYMIPILGLLAWGIATLWGIGTVALTAVNTFRKEGNRTNGVAAVPIPATTEAGQAPPILEVTATYTRAGFWIRLFATALDLVLVGALTALSHLPLVFVLLWLIYHVGMWTWKGTTIGGVVMGIKIVRLDGQPIDFAVALVRSLASIFSALVLFLGFFWAGWSREKRSWHDLIAGTIVVKVPKGMSLI